MCCCTKDPLCNKSGGFIAADWRIRSKAIHLAE